MVKIILALLLMLSITDAVSAQYRGGYRHPGIGGSIILVALSVASSVASSVVPLPIASTAHLRSTCSRAMEAMLIQPLPTACGGSAPMTSSRRPTSASMAFGTTARNNRDGDSYGQETVDEEASGDPESCEAQRKGFARQRAARRAACRCGVT